MNTFTTNIKSLLPAFLFLFGAFLTSSLAFAQSEKNEKSTSKVIVKSDSVSTFKKIINVEDVNGEKVVTVTTIQDGNKNVETFTGKEAEEYLENCVELKMKEATTSGFTFEDDAEDSENVKVIIMKSERGVLNSKDVIMLKEGTDENMEIVFIGESENGLNEDGVITIDVNYTDDGGKEMAKVIVMNETELVHSMEEMQALLEDMDIEIDFTEADEEGRRVKTVIVTNKIVIEENENSNDVVDSMWSEFTVSPNPSNGQLKINFTPVNKGKVIVTVLDMEGAVLFTDSYNGKSAYSKNINIAEYKGIVILKVEQGNEVEVRKLIIE